MRGTIEHTPLPDCLRSRQLGQRGVGRIQIQLHGSPTDVCFRLARFRRPHYPGRMGLCGILSIMMRNQSCAIVNIIPRDFSLLYKRENEILDSFIYILIVYYIIVTCITDQMG